MNKPQLPAKAAASLDQLSNSPEFNDAIDRDFGTATESHTDGFSRRRWLQLMGASLTLGGLSGCRYQEEKIAPFAFRPQTRVPGIPEKFASLTELGGIAEPLLATNYDGRPIKLDGNPDHPDSLGASSTYTQARMLEFYDPDRLREPLKSTGETFTESTWMDLVTACKFPANLEGVAVLAEPSASPSLMRLQAQIVAKGGSWFTFSAINDDNTRAGARLAFGSPARAHYNLADAKIIVSIDADPIHSDPGGIANAVSFAKGRDADSGNMSRLYAVESQFTTTGAAADHRISVASNKIAGFVAALAQAVEDNVSVDKSKPYREKVLAAMASDLATAEPGTTVIICGERQPPEVHAVVHALNAKLGNHGKTITFTKLPDADRPAGLEAIQNFADQLDSGKIKTAVVLGGNPVYDAPRALGLAEKLKKANNSLHISYYKNETSLACKWVSAVAHPLESWKDGYSKNGSVLIGQPLINPLFGGKSDIETLAELLGSEVVEGQAIVRETHGLSNNAWAEAVHLGFVADSAGEAVTPSIAATPQLTADNSWAEKWDGSSMEVVFTPSASLYDGRFANNAWLQELPDFFTKVTWDNVALVSPATAEALGAQQRGMSSKSMATMIDISIDGETRQVPIAIQPGQADGSIGLAIGYGRTSAGRVGGDSMSGIASIGHDIVPLRTASQWLVAPISKDAVKATGTNYKLAVVQEPWAIDETGRDEIQARMFRDESKTESKRSSLIREGSFASYEEFLKEHPAGEHNHGTDHAAKPAPKSTKAVAVAGALPVINQVNFVEEPAEDHDDHGHGKPHWPEAFHMHHELFDLTPGVREGYKFQEKEKRDPAVTNIWGKSIDLNKCIGCNSCVVACQSENNIPVVGKDDVWRGREMHWIRIDRYYGDNLYSEEGRADDKTIVHQPVACHHCENAPCETVCPVAATVHSSEGLNDMVYNRCIGTRYCGNNCPYKVRRFNFFNYTDAVTLLKYPDADKLPEGDRKLQNLMMNPEVTVRSRGVMEKCTYCVQRIQNGKITAKNESRPIGPNEITTACQDACPTQAIKFGDLHNEESDVAKAHANPRAYSMLEELNNVPRTKYLARVRNVHKDLMDYDDRDSIGYHGGGHDAKDHAGKDHAGKDHAGDGEKKAAGDTAAEKEH